MRLISCDHCYPKIKEKREKKCAVMPHWLVSKFLLQVNEISGAVSRCGVTSNLEKIIPWDPSLLANTQFLLLIAPLNYDSSSELWLDFWQRSYFLWRLGIHMELWFLEIKWCVLHGLGYGYVSMCHIHLICISSIFLAWTIGEIAIAYPAQIYLFIQNLLVLWSADVQLIMELMFFPQVLLMQVILADCALSTQSKFI